MSKKKKKNCDTREFTALKSDKMTNCDNKQTSCGNAKDCDNRAERMVFSDRDPKPSFEV